MTEILAAASRNRIASSHLWERHAATFDSAGEAWKILPPLGIAMLLGERTRLNNFISIALLMPLMTAAVIAALMWKLMTSPNFGVLSWVVAQFDAASGRTLLHGLDPA